MSEVKRYEINGTFNVPEIVQKLVNPKMVMEADFDRVTAERDAALGREAALREDLQTRTADLLECGTRRKELQQRLTAADERADQLTQQLAIESAIKEPAGEDVLWQVLDAAVGVLTRRAAPHAWESEAHQAGLKIILARRAGLAATALKPADGRGAEVMSFAQIAQFNDDNDHCPERDE